MLLFNHELPRDVIICFATRILRTFGFGSVGMILALYCRTIGLTDMQIGFLLSSAMLGDAVFSVFVVIVADKVGRARMLALGCAMMGLTGTMLAMLNAPKFTAVFIAVTFGIVSPSEYEFGPFAVLEQSILAGLVHPQDRTKVFALYQTSGFLASALGSLFGGHLVAFAMHRFHWSLLKSYHAIFVVYTWIALANFVLSSSLSSAAEVWHVNKEPLTAPLLDEEQAEAGLKNSHAGVVRKQEVDRDEEILCMGLRRVTFFRMVKLSGLSTLDAFAGAFITGSMLAYWLKSRYGVTPGALGNIFSMAMFVAGVSFLCAPYLASKMGLVNTMVVTHLIGSTFTILVPLMPGFNATIAMLFLRFSFANTHCVPRQSYITAIVGDQERTLVLGVVDTVRHIGASMAPALGGWLKATGHFDYIFFCCGGLKMLYDVILYWNFHSINPPEELLPAPVRVQRSSFSS